MTIGWFSSLEPPIFSPRTVGQIADDEFVLVGQFSQPGQKAVGRDTDATLALHAVELLDLALYVEVGL